MERLIYVPIENIPERYSEQWDTWFRAAFKREDMPYIPVGHSIPQKINNGQFLDVFGTLEYKSNQLTQILHILNLSTVPTTVFFMDLWFPGIEALAYLRDGLNYPLKIKGMLHAGTYDPNDFLYQKNMGHWGRDFESSFLKICDEVFLASNYHRELLKKSGLPTDRTTIVDWPCEKDFSVKKKENIVVFPHRLAPEKSPEEFTTIQSIFESKYGNFAQWIRSKDVCKNKQEYYDLLAISKVAVSTAKQETFGIAMAEAVNSFCIAVAPNRLSYPEILKDQYLYENLDEAAFFIFEALMKIQHTFQTIGDKEIKWVKKILTT